MLIKKPFDLSSSEITPREFYLNRRRFLAGAGLLAGASVLGVKVSGLLSPSETVSANAKLNYKPGPYGTTEKQTPFKDITNYNNYYEFSTDKYEPAKLAADFKPTPWSVKVDGLVNKPKTFDIDALMKMQLEERVYRVRCVEG